MKRCEFDAHRLRLVPGELMDRPVEGLGHLTASVRARPAASR
jgi:hypothetical protein